MERVLVECDRAEVGFDADAVHDLRVALRRCRSLADGLMAIDPDASWKEMKKAGKKLFQALGELRDMQVMEEWIEKLSPMKTRRIASVNRNPAESREATGIVRCSRQSSARSHPFARVRLQAVGVERSESV